MPIKLYGLLHCKEGERSAINFQPRDFQDQMRVYVRNAIHLANSLAQQGVGFTLFTNDKVAVDRLVAAEECVLPTLEIPFTTVVPTGAGFYSAHFKLDVFRHLAGLAEAYVGLCDLDMVCINPCPQSLVNAVAAGVPLCCDISAQVIPVHGRAVIVRDLELLHGRESEGRWSGGGFVAGPPHFFALLSQAIDTLYPAYLANIHRVHHIGDEMVTSAAIEVLRSNGVLVEDAEAKGIVGIYWNAETMHPQPPLTDFARCFLLHLPADKRFLADLARRSAYSPASFTQIYADYCKRSQFARAQLARTGPGADARVAYSIPSSTYRDER
jgi:hypothetical protein